MRQFIVTTSAAGLTRTQVWDSLSPLPLGHPMRWIAERCGKGIRIRHMGGRPGETLRGEFCEITEKDLALGAEVALPGGVQKLSLRIRPADSLSPAYAGSTGKILTLFSCIGGWALQSETVSSGHTVAHNGKKVFSFQEKGDSYAIQAHADTGLKLKATAGDRDLKSGETAELTREALSHTQIYLGAGSTYSWRFGLSQAVTISDSPVKSAQDSDTEWFKKALRFAVVGLGAFAVMSWLWPKPKMEKELIPAQFTKIVMSQPAKSEKKAAQASQTEAASSGSAAPVPEKVQKAAVVQAFRAKALSHAVSGLLKGGMTSLLAQSDFVSGNKASADARNSLNQRSSALGANVPTSGAASDTNVKIAAVGGNGKGVGYGKGDKAGVKGQGQAFVSMDIAGASVEEGLTKDEVGEIIHRHLSEVRYCYESAMIRTPDIEGKLMVNFSIGPNGMVSSTEIKSSTLPDPRLDDCILRRLVTWKFPNPRGGITVAVTYPFIFKTLGR